MALPIDVELTQEAAERAKRQLLDDLLPELIDRNMGPDGATYGTHDVERGDRILAFLEDRALGVHDRQVNGQWVAGTLRAVNPELEDRMQRQFMEDTNHSPLFGHTQTDDRLRESAGTRASDLGLEG